MKASLKQTNKLSSLKFKCWSWRRIPRSTLWTRTCFTLQHNSPVVQVKTALQTHIKQSQTEFIFMEELWFIPFAPWDIFYFSSWLEVIHLVLLHEVKYFISWDLLSVLYWSKNSYNFIKNSQYSQRATKKDCICKCLPSMYTRAFSLFTNMCFTAPINPLKCCYSSDCAQIHFSRC